MCKIHLFTREASEIGRHVEEIGTNHPQPDWAQQDPHDWWAAVRRGFEKCTRGYEGEIESIGICSHRESVLGLDDEGRPVTPCILWADRRCEDEALELEEHFGDEIHQRTGMKADPYFTAPKILWLTKNRPRVLENVSKFLLPKDYMVYLLTGEYSTDYSLASRTMMYDLRKREWWVEMLEYLGITEDLMCEPGPSHRIAGEVLSPLAGEFGFESSPIVVAGAGDRQCEAMGTGVTTERAMESTGSATNLSIATGSLPSKLTEGMLYSFHAEEGEYLLEQGIGSTGLSLRWFRDSFRPPSGGEEFDSDPYGFIDREASKSPPGSKGVVFLPFLMGAQASRWNSRARGVFYGLRLGHSYGDLGRSILEGIAFEISACIDVLKEQDQQPDHIMALGGASMSSLWNQIKADVTGRTYSRPLRSEAASLGALLLAMRGVGADLDIQKLNPVEKRWEPDPETVKIYKKKRELYEKLYRACVPLFRMQSED